MTLEEAKKILKKEGFYVEKATRPRPRDISESFTEYEDPTICEAMHVVCSAGYVISMEIIRFKERKARLKKELEEYGNAPMPGPGEEQPKEGNPALKEAASQFNDALLDEQGKKIKRLDKEISKLNSIIHDKNAVLDVAEELRLTKIREKNLTKVCQKYMKEKEELKKELEEKTQLVEIVRNASKEYCDYGVAANEFIKELAGLYVLANNNGIINDEMLERCKNYQTYGFPANCNRETKKEIDNIARGKENKKPCIPTPEEPKHGNSFKDFISKTIDNFNRRAANLGCVGSNDGNGIFDQMVGVDIAEEGGDHSATIVQCDNGITLSKEEAEIIERCTKNGTELHYSEKDGLTYTNVFCEEMPIRCLRGMFHVFTDEEIKNMKK